MINRRRLYWKLKFRFGHWTWNVIKTMRELYREEYLNDWNEKTWNDRNLPYIKWFFGWLFCKRCDTCDDHGMSGYWEKEVCCWCQGTKIEYNWEFKRIFTKIFENERRDLGLYMYERRLGLDPKWRK